MKLGPTRADLTRRFYANIGCGCFALVGAFAAPDDTGGLFLGPAVAFAVGAFACWLAEREL